MSRRRCNLKRRRTRLQGLRALCCSIAAANRIICLESSQLSPRAFPVSAGSPTEQPSMSKNKLHEMSDRTDLSPVGVTPKPVAPEQVYKPTPHVVHNALGKSNSTGLLHNKAAATQSNKLRPPVVDDEMHSLHGQSAIPADLNSKSRGYDSPTESDKRPSSVGPAAIAQQQVKRLKVHVNALMGQLDESYREKEMQRLEIDRMRNMIMKLTLEKGSADTANVRLSRQNLRGQQKYLAMTTGSAQFAIDDDIASSSLTSADVYGFPTKEDEAQLVLGPVPGVRLWGCQTYQGAQGQEGRIAQGQRPQGQHTPSACAGSSREQPIAGVEKEKCREYYCMYSCPIHLLHILSKLQGFDYSRLSSPSNALNGFAGGCCCCCVPLGGTLPTACENLLLSITILPPPPLPPVRE